MLLVPKLLVPTQPAVHFAAPPACIQLKGCTALLSKFVVAH